MAMPYPEFGPMWAKLRGNGDYLWHRTSPASYQAIIESGELLPNHGGFADTTTQSKNSLARHMGAISLCDFDTETAADIWVHYLGYWKPGVLIRISRAQLDGSKLLLPKRVAFLAQERSLIYVPYIEALYVGAIPITAFHGEPVYDYR